MQGKVSGFSQAASAIAANLGPARRLRCREKWRSYARAKRTSLQIIVANVGAATDTKHAKKK